MASNRILPDTCAWIDFFRGKDSPLARTLDKSLLNGEVVTCGIVLCELFQGIKSSREKSLVKNALFALPYLEMDRELWGRAGTLSSLLRSRGHILPLSDIIIATLAQSNDCAVLTIDSHFDAIDVCKIIKL